MHRRRFIALLGAAMTVARSLRAQQKAIPVIGVLNSASPEPPGQGVATFRQGLSETGYVEGKIWRSNTARPRVTMIGCPH